MTKPVLISDKLQRFESI